MPSEARLSDALALHQAGCLDEARVVYETLLADDPADDRCLHLLGLIAYQTGRTEIAIATIGRAATLRPDAAHYHCNLGNALRRAGRLDDAAAALRVARALRPESAEIASNLGAVLTDLGELPAAIEALRVAIGLDHGLADAHYNLGNALCRAGDAQAAVAPYRACLRLRPDFADAHFNLGHALAGLSRPREAEASLRVAIALDPDHVDALRNLGVLLQQHDRLEDAQDCYRQALRARPDDAEVRLNLGTSLLSANLIRPAAACFEEVLGAYPDHGSARLGRLMAHLPAVCRDEAEVAASRAAYTDALHRLIADAERPALRAALQPAIGFCQPFFLPYQEQDDRALQAAYGGLLCRLGPPPARLPPPPAAGERIRVGIVSGFFRDHTVWSLLIRGWLTQLDRARFEVFGYHTGVRTDDRTTLAATLCEDFASRPRSVAAWRDRVLGDAPHVLLYPEIGMDPTAAALAAQRLAPVQCAAWGHPVTTGLPSIDHFLSGAFMEPDDGAAHYTEHLDPLPNLGAFYEPEPTRPRARRRADFGFREGATLFWSGQNLPKYRPLHDEVFPRIACAVPDSQFVFIAYGHGRAATSLFADRLAGAFAAFGLDAGRHCVILNQLDQGDFLAAAGLCDVVLDTIGWSGGRSTLDLLALDPAIVTLPGRFMRGRHTAAILRMIDAAETVAGSVDGYVNLAVRLARDPDFRARVRTRVAAGKHRAMRDRAAIDGLEAFLCSVACPPIGQDFLARK